MDNTKKLTVTGYILNPIVRGLVLAAWAAITGVTVWLFFTGLPLLRQVSRKQPDLNEAVLNQIGLSFNFYTNFIVTFEILMALSFFVLGLLLVWFKSNDLSAMISATTFVLFGGLTSTFVLNTVMMIENVVPPERERLIVMTSYVGFILINVFLYTFPKGELLFDGLKWFLWGFIAWVVIGIIYPQYSLIYAEPFIISIIGQLFFNGVGIYAQIYNFRKRATAIQKQQTKWFVFAIGLILGGFVYFELLRVYTVTEQPSVFNAIFHTLFRFLFWYFPRILVPGLLWAALFRYRLWDVDFLINRSIVYSGVGILLVGVFGGTLYLVSLLTKQSLIVFGVASIAAGILFQPSQRRMQRFVDQKLYHIMIDYKKRVPELRKEESVVSFQQFSGLELIGQGGMAEIYKAQHPKRPEQVVLKLLPEELLEDAEFRLRFEREAKTVSMLKHPNIVNTYDYGMEDGIYYIVMEYISGQDLDGVLKEKAAFSLDEACPLLEQIADALDYAHDQGLVHRDIKPSNIMIDDSGRPVLVDFGIAKILDSLSTVTQSGFLGTLEYIAPEQIQASKNVDRKADLYSFGVMVYQMLTGEMPFKYNNPGAMLMAHMTQPPPNPRDKVDNLSPRAAFAITRSMAKNQDERFETVGEFVRELSN